MDARGDVILAGITITEPPGPITGRFTVIKLDKELGTAHWIATIDGGDAFAVAVDGAGDVIAAGVIGGGMGVAKFRGLDGVELWRAQPQGDAAGGQARALALDHAGNAIAVGFLRNTAFRNAFAIVKAAGADGSEQWRHVITPLTSGDGAVGVAVDATGDAVAIGSIRTDTGGVVSIEFAVLKVAGGDGSLRWRHDVSPGDSFSDVARALALDPVGDVIVAGAIRDSAGGHSAVVKLAGADGSEQWRHLADNASADRVAVDSGGNIAVGGVVSGPNRFDAVVKKVSGTTGQELWRTVLNGPGNGDDSLRAVAVDANGDVLMAGALDGGASGADFAVGKLAGVDGASF